MQSNLLSTRVLSKWTDQALKTNVLHVRKPNNSWPFVKKNTRVEIILFFHISSFFKNNSYCVQWLLRTINIGGEGVGEKGENMRATDII